MYKNNYKKAFTLIETIIVVVIMSILGTIAFTASQNYVRSAFNTSRKTNISNISTSLEIFSVKSGSYPVPTDWVQITFNGGEVWTQGTIWKSVVDSLDSLTKVIVDPDTKIPYTYSRLNTKGQYQIATVFSEEFSRNLFTENSYADSWFVASAYIKWNYNWVAAKVSTWGISYVLAIPSIISSDLSITDVMKYKDDNKFVYNWYENLPDNYKNSSYKIILDATKEYRPKEIIVYSSGSFDDLKNRNTQILLLNNLKNAYSWSIFVNPEDINKKIINSQLDFSSPSKSVQDLACDIWKYILDSWECTDYLTWAVDFWWDTIIWNGNWDGVSWNDPNNWDLKRIPETFDDVIIDMNVSVDVDTSSNIEIRSLNLWETRNSTLTLSWFGSFTADSEIHIYNKDVITHTNNSSSKEHILNLISSNITIDSWWSVNVSWKWYANEQGLWAWSSSSGKWWWWAYWGSWWDNSYKSNVLGNKYWIEELLMIFEADEEIQNEVIEVV